MSNDEDDLGPSHVPRKKPGRALTIQENRAYDRYVIKCTLSPLCKYAVVREEIEDAVFWLSKLQIHAHHVMTMHLLQNKGKLHSSKNMLGMWNSMFRCLSNTMSGKTKQGEYTSVCNEYAERTALQKDWPDDVTSTWRGKVLEQMALVSATVHQNHIETNYLGFVTRYIRYLLRETDGYSDIRELPVKSFNKVFSVITSSLDIHRDKTVDEIVKMRPSTLDTVPLERDVWTSVKNVVKHLRETYAKPTMTLSEKSEAMYNILDVLCTYKEELHRRWMDGIHTPGIRKKYSWTFSICPQMQWTPKHIHISTTALKELYRKLSNKYSKLKELHDECLEKSGACGDEWSKKFVFWDSLFNLNRVMRQKHLKDPSNIRFANFISTDGVSVSCGFQKRKSDCEREIQKLCVDIGHKKKQQNANDADIKDLRKKLREMKKEFEKRTHERHSIDMVRGVVDIVAMSDGTYICPSGHRIVGLDPGVRNPATWIVHDPESQKQHLSWKISEGATHSSSETRYDSGTIGNGWWSFHSGQKMYMKKMKKRLMSHCPEKMNTPTTKTCDIDKLVSSYRFQCGILPNIMTAYFGGDKWYQKQKMRQFVKKKQAIENVVSSITGTRNKEAQMHVVVAHGDGDFQGTMRGVPPVLTKSLTKKLCQDTMLVFVNEYLTSQKCSCCLSSMKQEKNSFRVKHCSNSDCIRTTWNRDINASINILSSFLHDMTHEHRHPVFSRTTTGAA